MKNFYASPEVEVILQATDVITTSDGYQNEENGGTQPDFFAGV